MDHAIRIDRKLEVYCVGIIYVLENNFELDVNADMFCRIGSGP